WLAPALLLPRPEPDDQGCERKDHEGIECLEPSCWDFAVPENEIDRSVGIVVGPERDRVALLLVSRPEQCRGQEQEQQCDDAAPLALGQWLLLGSCFNRCFPLIPWPWTRAEA